jgi:hypothetical protein
MGDLSQLPPALAAWSPDMIFRLVGAYLMSERFRPKHRGCNERAGKIPTRSISDVIIGIKKIAFLWFKTTSPPLPREWETC